MTGPREFVEMHPETPTLHEELFEATPSGLVAIDRSGLIAFVNRRAEVMLGRSRSDLVGKPLGAVVAENSGGTDAASSRPGRIAQRNSSCTS